MDDNFEIVIPLTKSKAKQFGDGEESSQEPLIKVILNPLFLEKR